MSEYQGAQLLTLHNVHYAPACKTNLLAAGYCSSTPDVQFCFNLQPESCKLVIRNSAINIPRSCSDGMYLIKAIDTFLSISTIQLGNVWHQRLGHIGNTLTKTIPLSRGIQSKASSSCSCETCSTMKFKSIPAPKKSN
jgi:hypothetical protein